MYDRLKSDRSPPSEVITALAKTLRNFRLPDDYVSLRVVRWQEPSAFVGVGHAIYLSDSFIDAIDTGDLSLDEVEAVLGHEIAHLLLDHPINNKATFSVSVVLETDPNELLNRATSIYVAHRATGTYRGSAFREKQMRTQMLLNGGDGFRKHLLRDGAEIANARAPALGYTYPLDQEIAADNMARRVIGPKFSMKLQSFLRWQLELAGMFANGSSDDVNVIKNRLSNIGGEK